MDIKEEVIMMEKLINMVKKITEEVIKEDITKHKMSIENLIKISQDLMTMTLNKSNSKLLIKNLVRKMWKLRRKELLFLHANLIRHFL